MFNSSSNSAKNVDTSSSLSPKSRNVAGNRIDTGWKHGTNILGNEKKK